MVKTARARLAVVLAAGVSGAACVAVPREPPQAAPRVVRRATATPVAAARPGLREQVLPSGLRVLWDEAPAGSLAAVVSVVRGGSRLDPPGEEGLAHLVEHLTYRAVDPLSSGDVPLTRWNRLIRAAVGEMNGYTTPDCLIFYETAAPAQLPALLGLEVARLAEPLAAVDDRAFALERDIIGSENLLRSDPRAGEWPPRQMFPHLFPAGHPYARPTGGTDESRARLTLAGARAYAARVFRPENVTLLVSTPPGTSTLPALIDGLPPALRDARGTGAPAASGTPASPAPPEAGGATPPLARVPSPLPTAELWLAWTLPGSYGDDGPAEELLADWLQDDLASEQLFKEESGIQHVAAHIQPGVDAGVLFVRTLLAPGANAERVARVVSARVTSLWSREPAARGTFAGLRATIETERLLDEPGQTARVLREATDAALGGHVRSVAETLARVQEVTSASVAKLAYQSLTAERAHVTLFVPEPPGRKAWTPAGGGRAAEAVDERAAHDLVAGAAGWNTEQLRALVPPSPQVRTAKTAAGLTVVTARRPGVSAVALLGFRGGYADASPPLLVELALRARPDATQAPALHILPGRGATRDLSFDAVEFRPDRINEALALLFAKATTMVKSWPDHDGLARALAPLATAEAATRPEAEAAFWRALFGDHRDARQVTTADLDKVTHSDVDAWVGRVHNVRNAVLVVVGDVDPALVLRAAEVLSKESTRPAWLAEIPTPRPPAVRAAGTERIVPVVSARASALVDLRLGCLLPAMTSADTGPHALLAEAMEARLNDAIRIEQGDGYGVNVGVQRLRDGATFLTASTFVPEQGLARALSVLHSHWRRWGRTGFDASEINVARWRAAGSYAMASASPHQLAMQLLDRWSVEPATFAAAPLQPDLAAARAARVNELFATCRANAVLGLTGDEARIRRALDQAWPELR
jgi:zinc protease